jgi:hypothetical protein
LTPDVETIGHRVTFRRWIPFLIVAAGTACLCLAGGRFGRIGPRSGEFIALFCVTWVHGALAILAAALVCRLLLLPHPASDDVNRYVWEGRVLASGVSPYAVPPDDPTLLAMRDAIWSDMNHRDMTACYPPVMMLLFAGITTVWESLPAMKLVMVLFDIGTVWLLLLLLRDRRLN